MKKPLNTLPSHKEGSFYIEHKEAASLHKPQNPNPAMMLCPPGAKTYGLAQLMHTHKLGLFKRRVQMETSGWKPPLHSEHVTMSWF